MSKSRSRTARTKLPLTPKQQLAIERRKAERELADSLDGLREALLKVPENYRVRAAQALEMVLGGGHRFAVACAKAYISRDPWPSVPSRPALEFFITAENQIYDTNPRYKGHGWNDPDYEIPAAVSR
jgi:hypothetical protein